MIANESLPLHPVCELFPRLSEKVRGQLKDSIVRTNGFDLRVVAWRNPTTDTLLLIDGRHRQEIAVELKIPFDVSEFIGTEEDAIDHAWDLNDARRQMTNEQRYFAGADMARLLAVAAGDRMMAGTPASIEAKGRSAAHAASAVGCSRAQVERAGRVRDFGAPEVVAAAKLGEVSVSDAATIACFSKGVQIAALVRVRADRSKTLREAVAGFEIEAAGASVELDEAALFARIEVLAVPEIRDALVQGIMSLEEGELQLARSPSDQRAFVSRIGEQRTCSVCQGVKDWCAPEDPAA